MESFDKLRINDAAIPTPVKTSSVAKALEDKSVGKLLSLCIFCLSSAALAEEEIASLPSVACPERLVVSLSNQVEGLAKTDVRGYSLSSFIPHTYVL